MTNDSKSWKLRAMWRAVLVAGVMCAMGSACHAQARGGGGGGGGRPIATLPLGGASGNNTSSTAAARTLNGVVRDAQDKVVSGAIVYLKDLRTAKLLSVMTDDAGAYRFVGLENNVDYEFWAQTEGHKSDVKTVSSYDNSVQMVRGLQLK